MDNVNKTGASVYKPKVYLLTLGCDKNRVDGEVMLGNLIAAGMASAAEAAEAEAIIVNTCGFISEATQESIDTILDMAEYKHTSKCRALVVVGCMSERYREETKAEIPEVDAVLGVKDTDTIVQVVSKLLDFTPQGIHDYNNRLWARKYTYIPHIAHVKISDGCDNNCAYCTIPSIRGAYASRSIEDILKECENLVATGAREIVLVAQDTALYGLDLYGKPRLHELLIAISDLFILDETANCHLEEKDKSSHENIWIRLMYVHPEHITQEIINAIAMLPNVCKYIDMPIQHSETDVLKRMGRNISKEGLLELIGKLRKEVPGIALRTTVMVGFPGETEEDFARLAAFLDKVQFDRLGVFPYSQEQGTPAALLPNQIEQEVKHTRLDTLMQLQQDIHHKKQQVKVGHTTDVIIDKPENVSNFDSSEFSKHLAFNEQGVNFNFGYIGRTMHDAYEVDAVVKLTTNSPLLYNGGNVQPIKPGDIIKATITNVSGYDLIGVVSGNESGK